MEEKEASSVLLRRGSFRVFFLHAAGLSRQKERMASRREWYSGMQVSLARRGIVESGCRQSKYAVRGKSGMEASWYGVSVGGGGQGGAVV